MLDIRKIRENPDFYRERLGRRNAGDEKLIADVLVLDEKRRKHLQEGEALKSERNRASKEIGAIKAKGGDIAEVSAKMKAVGDQIARLDQELTGIEAGQSDLLLRIPNVNHDSVPVGKGPEENRIERVIGKPAAFDFKPRPHWEIGTQLGLIDLEAATKISGGGFIVFKGAGARLERALINYLLDLHTGRHGYTEISPPFLVRGESMIGTSQLPKFAEDMYRVGEEPPLYLVPTAEVPVTNLHREEILATDRLPIRYAAYTPCFRREAGSAGKDTRGMIRVHQFDKVELVHIVTPEESYAALEVLVGHAEKALRELGLHYRVVSLCTGDIGFGAAKCYDLEVWAPGVGAWLEVSSCSNFEDFQARRMNLRYKNSEGKNIFCHTLNGSGLALPRLYIALLETYQQADGHVFIPEPLRPYLGGLTQL
ncbi:MAG TPA: serine--tRNA ligase [Candidatus Methylacidiphilales bacterium]|jgi:seryl-tRNA synthetase|nr:serine--tRNA ligase [Candidatus Methylacidiphilales bacterium]